MNPEDKLRELARDPQTAALIGAATGAVKGVLVGLAVGKVAVCVTLGVVGGAVSGAVISKFVRSNAGKRPAEALVPVPIKPREPR